jgi:hypothetical protein
MVCLSCASILLYVRNLHRQFPPSLGNTSVRLELTESLLTMLKRGRG